VVTGAMLTYVFGDTHGCNDPMMKLVAKVEAHSGGRDHRRVWLGDYIDRGTQSAQLVSYLIRSRGERPQDIFLMGNHEDMLLANVDDYPSPYDKERREILAKSFFVNGGRATLTSYGIESVTELPQDHLDFFKSLALSWEDDLRYYVHAGVRPGVPLGLQDHHDQLWIRGEFLSSTETFEKYIVHGHTPVGPEVEENRCNLDSGVYVNGTLTAGFFDAASRKPRELLQVRST
jgi:serine/threonine protein phosphatase 1